MFDAAAESKPLSLEEHLKQDSSLFSQFEKTLLKANDILFPARLGKRQPQRDSGELRKNLERDLGTPQPQNRGEEEKNEHPLHNDKFIQDDELTSEDLDIIALYGPRVQVIRWYFENDAVVKQAIGKQAKGLSANVVTRPKGGAGRGAFYTPKVVAPQKKKVKVPLSKPVDGYYDEEYDSDYGNEYGNERSGRKEIEGEVNEFPDEEDEYHIIAGIGYQCLDSEPSKIIEKSY